MAFGSMYDENGDMPMAEINVTPLVDVMLVLMIVFMITMPLLTHSIPLQLPITSGEEKQPLHEPLRLSIDKNGAYLLEEGNEGRQLSLPQLQQKLLLVAQQDPQTVLAIAADKQAAYDHVAQALQASRSAGLTKVGFVTQTQHGK